MYPTTYCRWDTCTHTYISIITHAYTHTYAHTYTHTHTHSKVELDPLPRVLLVEHVGLICLGRTHKACAISCDIYCHTVPTLLSALASGGSYKPASLSDLFDCEYWSLEQAKLKVCVYMCWCLYACMCVCVTCVPSPTPKVVRTHITYISSPVYEHKHTRVHASTNRHTHTS